MAVLAVALRVAVASLLVGAASLAGQRWGDRVGGWLVALALTSGPVAFILPVDHGLVFAGEAAIGMMAGSISQRAFALAFRMRAAHGWAAGLVAGGVAFAVAAKAELDRGEHPADLPAAAYLLGSVVLTPVVLREPLGWLASPSGALVAIFLGGVTMALGNVLPIAGMRSMPSGPASTLLLADPLTATTLGVVVLGERIPPVGLAGLTLVAVGLILQTRALSTPPGTARPVTAPLGASGQPNRPDT